MWELLQSKLAVILSILATIFIVWAWYEISMKMKTNQAITEFKLNLIKLDLSWK